MSRLSLCLLLSLQLIACEGPAPATSAPAKAEAPAVVQLTTLGPTTLRVQRTALGEAVARSDASLSVAEAGRVRRVHVGEGDQVKQGQLLVELDDRLARAELSEALVSKRTLSLEEHQASREAQRYRQLEQEAVISSLEADREVDEAERLAAQKEGAQAAIDVQSERVQRHRVVAPFDGVVARRLVDPGDWLNPGEKALQLVTAERVEVLVRVPKDLLSRLPTLSKLELHSDGNSVEGALSGVVKALDPATRTGLLRVYPKKQPEWLVAGSSVEVSFDVQQDGGFVVPRDALVYGVGNVRVVRESAGKAEPVMVEVLETAGNLALIATEQDETAAPLKAGERVVVRGNERLRPGQVLQVRDEAVPEPDGSTPER